MATIVDGWYSGAVHFASPFFNQRPTPAIDLIVIHNISLPLGNFATGFVHDLFLGCLDCNADPSFSDLLGLEVSAHFFIDRRGTINQFVSLDDRAWHAGVSHYQGRDNCNDYSIGIELEGTDTEPYSEQQYQSLAILVNSLMQHCDIAPEAIVGHSDIAPGRKTDPGAHFNWGTLKQLLDKQQG